MTLKKLPLFVSSAVLFIAQAQAGAPAFSDTRALAMGGVGVTAARPAAAGFFNPALLAVKHPEKRNGFGMLLPSVNAVAYDKDELRDVADNFEDDYVKPFEAAITNLENKIGVSGQADAQLELANRTTALNGELQRIDKAQARIDLGLGLSFLVPSETIGAGVFVSGSARIAAQLNYNDAQKLSDLEDLARNTSITDISQVEALYNLSASDEQLDSTMRAVGSAYSQVGIALSHSLSVGSYDLALGVSPKMVDLRAYDYVGTVENFESDGLEDTKESASKFNLDIGVVSYIDAKQKWLVGAAIMNVLPMSIDTNPGIDTTNINTGNVTLPSSIEIELKPTLTAGVSYQGDSYEIATDLQLNKTEEIFGECDTQYWGIGAEYDLAEIFQLRAGARYNLAESEATIFSAGFGLNVVGITLELAALGSTNSNTLGASAQLGLTF